MELSGVNQKSFKEVYQLLEEAFPVEELRPYKNARKILEDERYKLYKMLNKNELRGIIAAWNLEDFIFIEHFTVSKAYRGMGLGSEMMKLFLDKLKCPVVIEVEDYKTEIAKRRIAFYQRLGFHLSEFGYEQPVLRGDKNKKIPLRIMTYPAPLDEAGFLNFKKRVFEDIYKLD